MRVHSLRLVAVSAALVLAACGNDSPTSTIDTTSTARGTLIEDPPLRIASLDAPTLNAELMASAAGQQLLLVAGAPACGVDFNYFHYWTVGGMNETATASGALMVPTGGAGCTGARPIVLYAHGTDTNKNLNLADITDPTNSEGALIAAMFAAQGYIVVAPNYAGYDTSSLDYHPFLNGDQQSKDMIDALTAARQALGHVLASTTTDSGKLFITGYSQGGYVAMATHKAMQAAGMTVTASAPMSGPYALEAFGDFVFLGHVNLGSTIFTPMITTSYQRSYGNIYAATTDVFEAAYAPTIEGLLPSTMTVDSIIGNGLLPQLELFNSNTPGNGDASSGSALLDAYLAEPSDPNDPNTPLFRLGFGTSNLIKNSYRIAYVADLAANPDGAVPQTNLLPAAAPANSLRQAFKTNDLRSWTPAAPVLMCGGAGDPVVFFPVNTLLMQAYWQNYAPQLPPGVVTVLDVASAITGPNDPFLLAKGGFAQAEAAIDAGAGGGAAGFQARVSSYHSTVAPFCSAAARGFFGLF
ncbi:MAG TPA: prolyl oligopeptidase family serine peptidase [Steroidobacteraceae bacterium]|nr:prolyl oligopeptidase family serine peptidase [Steroidobacteraceae bacterium]